MSEVNDEFLTLLMQTLIATIFDNANDPQIFELFEQHKQALEERYFDYELLKAALERQHGMIAIMFINRGHRVRNPNKTNSEETPLHLAMKIDNEYFLSIISDILNKGASIYDKNLLGETALYAAFKNKNYKAVDIVLDYISNCHFKDLNPANEDDILHFHIACVRKHLNSVKIFLESGFDVNSYLSPDFTEFHGLSPLHYAICYNYYSDLFLILLQHSSGNLSIKNDEGLTPLHIIYYNNYKVTQAFEHGNDTKFVNVVDNNGVSHFHLCCSINYPSFVQVFINNGVDVNGSTFMNCPINPGFTPLHFAVKNDCTEVVELLLKHGADCKKSDENGLTPLHLACLNCETLAKRKIIEILLNYNACPVAADKAGNTPIHLVFFKLFSCPTSVEQNIFDTLMSKVPLKLLTDSDGVSLFHIACTRNDINQVNDFLNSGIMIDRCVTSGKFSGYTALHFAVLFNRKDVVEVLLKRDAQVNIKSSQSEVTPLHLACEFRLVKFYELNSKYTLATSDDKSVSLDWISNRISQIEIIKLLLLHGADVDSQDSSGKTPLLQVCTVSEHEYSKLSLSDNFKRILANEINIRVKEIIEILISNKANVHVCTNDQLSILHILGKTNLLNISNQLMEYLITAGVDVHAVDSNGLTPLHHAVECKNKEIVKILLKHKANVNAQCKFFRTPLKIVIDQYNSYLTEIEKYNPKDMFDILLDNGSDVNIRNHYGRTVFHDVILSNKNVTLIEKLLCYGADINMIDSDYYSSLNIDIIEVVFIHVQKFFALGIPPSETEQKKCRQLSKFYEKQLSHIKSMRTLDSILLDCLEELKRLQCEKIDNYNSLYNILLKDSHELAKHVRNSNLVNRMEDQNFDDKFPFYSCLLKKQFRKGLIRGDVLTLAEKSLTIVLGLNLPDPCCDRILQYLTNEEVANLKPAAVQIIKNLLKSG